MKKLREQIESLTSPQDQGEEESQAKSSADWEDYKKLGEQWLDQYLNQGSLTSQWIELLWKDSEPLRQTALEQGQVLAAQAIENSKKWSQDSSNWASEVKQDSEKFSQKVRSDANDLLERIKALLN
eukprot:TRINITY_DN115_c0_g1_i5.p1 TRINITY_DN115_c0_g1~~TRINITY_DN115_c0_g1_i5.p1  ORF type:complete len:126 (+),score=32.11 TRINITY_DN115_c0_g1_i5:347-724(+)